MFEGIAADRTGADLPGIIDPGVTHGHSPPVKIIDFKARAARASERRKRKLAAGVLTRTHRRLFEFLVVLWNVGGKYAFPKLPKLAEHLDVSVRRVQQLLRDLEAHGYIKRVRVHELADGAELELREQGEKARHASENWQQNVYTRGDGPRSSTPPDGAGEPPKGAGDEREGDDDAREGEGAAAALEENQAIGDPGSCDFSPERSCPDSSCGSSSLPYAIPQSAKHESGSPPRNDCDPPRARDTARSDSASPSVVPAPSARAASMEAAQAAGQVARLLEQWHELTGMAAPPAPVALAMLGARLGELVKLGKVKELAIELLRDAAEGANDPEEYDYLRRARCAFAVVFRDVATVQRFAHWGRKSRLERAPAEGVTLGALHLRSPPATTHQGMSSSDVAREAQRQKQALRDLFGDDVN